MLFRQILKHDRFLQFWSRSYQTYFSQFFFSSLRLGHFSINNFFLHLTKTQAYQQKTEKFFVREEKKFGRIDFSSSRSDSDGCAAKLLSKLMCCKPKKVKKQLSSTGMSNSKQSLSG